MNTASQEEEYKIRLNVFEGPMDLLLHLIKQSKIDIRDIPIALITEQYLAYIRMMQDLNLDVAGDFLVMASYLMYLKSRTLLCPGLDDEEDPEEAKQRLAQRLIEYQACKKGADILASCESKQLQIIPSFGIPIPCEEEMIEADLFDLLDAYYILFKEQINPAQPHKVSIDPIAVQDEMSEILAALRVKKKVFFRLLYEYNKPEYFIIGFLAILELARTHKVKILQGQNFGDIVLYLA
ncbi:MAG: segregation and condensation protein A [bacterium]